MERNNATAPAEPTPPAGAAPTTHLPGCLAGSRSPEPCVCNELRQQPTPPAPVAPHAAAGAEPLRVLGELVDAVAAELDMDAVSDRLGRAMQAAQEVVTR